MSVLKVKNGNQWDIVPAIKGDTGDPAADESITDDMLVTDGIKTEIEWLWGNQLMDIREGEILQTDDAYEAPLVSIDVDGKSTQVQTTGKNLVSDVASDWVSSSISGASRKTLFIPVEEGESYTYHRKAAYGAVGFIGTWYNDATEESEGVGTWTNLASKTVTNDGSWTHLVLSIAPSSFSIGVLHSAEVQVEKGASFTTYEPYSDGKPSPSPDWPQPIVNTDAPTLKLTQNAAMMLEQGGFNTNGINNTNQPTTRVRSTGFMPVSAGEMLTIESATSDVYASVSWYTSANIDSARTGYVDFCTLPLTATVPSGATFARMLFKKRSAGTASINVDELADLTVTSSLHGTYSVLTVPLYDGTLRSLPDGTKDELHLSYLRPSTREGWAWYSRELVQNVSPIVLNGILPSGGSYTDYSFNVSRSSASPDYTYIYSGMWDSVINGVGACDKLVQLLNAAGGSGSVVDTDSIGNGSSAYRIRMLLLTTRLGIDWDADTAVARTRKFNAWIVDNPITALCKLATPITTQLDPIEMPIMPSKDTTIWSDPSAQLKVTYIQDTNLVIESLEATVADMATS